MRTLTTATVGVLLAVATSACSSGSSARTSSPTAAPHGPTTTTPSGPTTASAAADAGFTFVYDTVTGPYTGAKEWISRGGASTQIPEHGYTLNNAVPATDGRRLLVAQTSADGSTTRTVVIDLTGRVTRVLPDSTGCFPGGLTQAVAIVTCGRSETDWQVLAIDPAGHRRVLGPVNPGSSAALSPDGTTVLAASGTRLYIVPVRGGSRRSLTDTGQARDTGAWSADGRRIVYLGARDTGGQSVYLIDADGTGRRKVADVPFDGDLHLTISPDGTRVLVAGSAQEESQFWTVGVDGSRPYLVSSTLTGGDPHALTS